MRYRGAMGRSNVRQTRLLGFLVLALGVVIALPKLRSEEGPPEAPCPQEFPQTRMAATLLWSRPDVGFGATSVSPVDARRPEELRLLAGDTDAAACAAIGAAIPDSLKPLGILAPRYAAFYALGDLYVVPVVPRITPSEIQAEARGERIVEKVGITFVYDADMNVVGAFPN